MSVNLSLDSTVQTEALDPTPTTSSPVNAAVANYEALYESALQSIQQMLQQVFAEEASIGAGNIDNGGQSDSGMTAQGASGALAAYMHQNGIGSLDPNKLYQMAYSPAAGTPSEVSDAAKFMLSNPDVYNQIETHDVAGSDGIAGVNDFDWAAQGGLSDASNTGDASSAGDADFLDASATIGDTGASLGAQSASGASLDAQSASGALGAYQHEQGIRKLDPNQLYQIAYNPASGTPSEVSAAAKFMLSNPDTYNRIETHDVAGSDGISGVSNFDWAAQGGLDNV
jgi:2-keto-3-deoxy-6-phosphogluconate aldolase